MATRLTPKRIGAAILGASIVLLTSALPAAADAVVVKPHPGADVKGMGIFLEGKEKEIHTELIGLKIIENGKDQTATAYCVELPTALEDNTPLEEVPWDEHPNEDTDFKANAKFVNWILHHSYPTLDVEAAQDAFELPTIKESSLIAGTQAAIWHYSDGANLDNDNPTVEGDDVDADVLAVYKHLTGEKNVGLEQEPAPTLDIKQELLEGTAGGALIGPFEVVTTSDKGLILTAEVPEGVAFTDKDGNPLQVAEAGQLSAQAATHVSEVFVKVDAGTEPGEVEFTVSATAKLHHGRLFVAQDKQKKTQSLVIAKPADVDVKDKAKVKWVEGVVTTTTTTVPTTTTTETTTTTTEAPTTTTTTAAPAAGGGDDDLANTGASIFVPLLIGLGLLGAGAGALLILRRKRAA
jgi:TQXA domain-containing protein/LPXTG-motif cell wall-anchored protein